MLLLPDTSVDQAQAIANRIITELQARQIEHQASPIHQVVTASAGVCTVIPTRDLTPRDLLKAADQALYQAKAQGRHQQVVVDHGDRHPDLNNAVV